MSNRFPVFPVSGFPSYDRKSESMAGQIGREAPRTPWDKFLNSRFRWQPGEHVGLIGPTGQGKTTLLINLLPQRRFVAVAATKPVDKVMSNLVRQKGYIQLERWISLDPKEYPKRVVWPNARDLASDEIQARVFADMMARIYREGGWTLAIDELWWFDRILGLKRDVQKMLLQARSLNISLVCGTQRPAWVPRELYTSATHLFFWRTNDEDDLKSLSGIGFLSARLIMSIVSRLDQFEMLYINTRTGEMMRTKVPRKGIQT